MLHGLPETICLYGLTVVISALSYQKGRYTSQMPSMIYLLDPILDLPAWLVDMPSHIPMPMMTAC